MSPEIRIDGKVILDVPDKKEGTLLYQTLDGRQILVNLEGINSDNKDQQIALVHPLGPSGEWIGQPQRSVGLTQEGKGSTAKTKKGGDGKEPVIEVSLHEPIKIAQTEKVWRAHDMRPYGESNGGSRKNVIKSHPNPYWQRR